MEVGEAHAFGGQLVEDRSLHGAAVASDVAVAQIVNEEGDDIRETRFRGANKKRAGGSENQQRFDEATTKHHIIV